jgi:hypothetical protein
MRKHIVPLVLVIMAMVVGFSMDVDAKASAAKKKTDKLQTEQVEDHVEEIAAKVEKKVKKKKKKKQKKAEKVEAKNVTPDGSVTVEDADMTAADVIEEAKEEPKQIRWEYIAVDLKPPEKDKYRRKWNALGREGWELTGSRLKAGDTDVYIFKRPILDYD